MQAQAQAIDTGFSPDFQVSKEPVAAEHRPLDAAARSEMVRRLFQEHNRALIGFLVVKLRSEAEAQDVAQEAYVRLLQLEQGSAVSFLRAHLFAIAGNLAIDRLRQRQVRERNSPQDFFEELLTRPGPDRSALAQQELEVIKSALKELPEKCRRAFMLHVFAEKSVVEIAAEMQLTDRMIRHYIARAMSHCRQRLDAAGSA
ncbi:RNA polymerase sigma-70 factor, ECF subfamily [Solimonas aquatica]|uniref:RNA polymerase sigma-70 factor, ECF subfamily n=2 Tax=Solimonas aquatica TaxID=489703 RepID=A0A1H9FVA5_9GAMM|nr:RNA polymerase sigma-70 factor, ECF subfamily [Solimonas aquatica]